MIPWWGLLSFRTYNSGKLVKYGILVHKLCEATASNISNMEIYTTEGKKLEETIFSVLEPYLDLWHHAYQDNYYNRVEIAEKLLLRKTRVCWTIRPNKGIPKSLADSSKKLKRGDTICHQKGVFFDISGRIRGRFTWLVQYIMAPLEMSPTNLEKG
jgi:hypothetical protein